MDFKMDFKNFIRETYLFRDLTDDELEKLESGSTEVLFRKGETIYKQGNFATHAVYQLEGYSIVFTEIQNYQRIIKIIKPGWFVGLMSVFSMEKHLFSAEAAVHSRLRMIDKNILKEVLHSNSTFAFKFIKELSLLGSSLTNYLVLQNTKNVRGRLAEILVHLSENIYKSDEFQLLFTRKEIGALANTSTETAIRILNDFKKEGIIETKEKIIRIKDIGLLKKAISLG